MKRIRNFALLCLALGIATSVLWACVSLPEAAPVAIWTPEPLMPLPALATETETVSPTETPTLTPSPSPSPSPSPTETPVQPSPTPTRTATTRPTRTPTAVRLPSATPDANLFVVRESDIADAMASGAVSDQGAVIEDLEVRFRDGKINVTAARVEYGMVRVQNLAMVGRLVATNGQLKLEIESISPRGLVTALLPTVANQMLGQYASDWYFEEVKTLDGRIEVRVR